MTPGTRVIRTVFLVTVLALIATACQATAELSMSDGDPFEAAAPSAAGDTIGGDATSPRLQDDEQVAEARRGGVDDQGGGADNSAGGGVDDPGGGVDFSLERDDVACDDDLQGLYPNANFAAAHVVVDGNLGALCFGERDDRLVQAWEILAAITPPGQLHDLGLFGGFITSELDETTLAFVNRLDDAGTVYQMSVNLDEADFDPDELMLTMAHEFSHVFTALSTQIDRFTFPEDFETWDNGEGCYLEDSLMWEWIQLFWGDALVSGIDPFQSPTGAAGESLCSINPGFLGSYAASHPEEDFAESFAAFVFQIEVTTPELTEKVQWFAEQPGLVEFRDRAVAAGFGPLPNEFEVCGQ